MVAIIFSIVLIVCLWVMGIQDAISRWMDDAEFDDEPSDDAPDLDNSEYDWGHNVKGYKHEDEE